MTNQSNFAAMRTITRRRIWIVRIAAKFDWFVIKHLSADRKSTRLNSSHLGISYAVFCLKKNKRLYFSKITATIRIAAPQRRAMNLLLFLGRQRRKYSIHPDAVTLLDAIHQIISIGNKKLGIECENPEIRMHARGDVHQHHAFGAKSGGHRDVALEVCIRPTENFFGTPSFHLSPYLLQMFFHCACS